MRIAICGAGIIGVATAYYLSQKNSEIEILVIDKNQPLSFTTSKSGENFRDYWPQKCIREFVGRSIDLMDDLQNQYGKDAFEMTYSGYNFITEDREKAIFGVDIESGLKSGIHETSGFENVQKEHPYLKDSIEKMVTIKKAGKIDVYALGSLLIKESKKRGAKFITGEILSISKKDEKFEVNLDSNEAISADKIVIASGPYLNHIAGMLGLEFPVFNTLQRKFIVPDPQNIVPRDMPFTIFSDEQYLDWSEEEKEVFASDEKYKWLLQKFPGGLHIKPEGTGIKLGWAFQTNKSEPMWEIPPFEFFPQAVLKGASRFISGLEKYANDIPAPLIEYGGFYTRTKENWPLVGATTMKNVFVNGAFAGYGTMGACAAGELCASHLFEEKDLPDYANYLDPARYENERIIKEMAALNSDGQL